jgi:hypothetical protein
MWQFSHLVVASGHAPLRIIRVRLHDGVFGLQTEADEEIVEDTCAPAHGLEDADADDDDEPLPPTDVAVQWARRRSMRQARASSQSRSQRQPHKSPPTLCDSLMVVPDSEGLAEPQPHDSTIHAPGTAPPCPCLCIGKARHLPLPAASLAEYDRRFWCRGLDCTHESLTIHWSHAVPQPQHTSSGRQQWRRSTCVYPWRRIRAPPPWWTRTR